MRRERVEVKRMWSLNLRMFSGIFMGVVLRFVGFWES